MGSSQGEKCLVIIHYYDYLSCLPLFFSRIHRFGKCLFRSFVPLIGYTWEKITQFYHSISEQMYRSLVQLWMEKKKMSDSSQICVIDFYWSLYNITNQSTNIEYCRVLSILNDLLRPVKISMQNYNTFNKLFGVWIIGKIVHIWFSTYSVQLYLSTIATFVVSGCLKNHQLPTVAAFINLQQSLPLINN